MAQDVFLTLENAAELVDAAHDTYLTAESLQDALPSYVDDVIEGYMSGVTLYEDASHQTAITPEQGKIYVDLTDNSTYRWSGSAYVAISNPLDFATYADAKAGTNNTKVMTPLRVKQAISHVPEWDSTNNYYFNESIKDWLDANADGQAYGISIPKTASVQCTKTAANAGIANPVPGIIGRPSVDPYTGLGPFRHYDVNAVIDADGTPHVTAIDGDGRFKRDGSNGDVWVMTPMIWWREDDGDEYCVTISDTRLSGMQPWPRAYLPDGTLRPYLLFAKYLGCEGDDGYMHSYSGRKAWIFVSHNSLITQCREGSTGYAAKTSSDLLYMQLMGLLKYANKDFNTVMYGCLDYNIQVPVTVATTNQSYVVIAKAEAANLVVGSTVSVGTRSAGNSDRGQATMHDVVDCVRVLRIEAHDSSNSRVYLDSPVFSTQTTYYVSTYPWSTGACDEVEGDGSPTSFTSGKEPFKLQGIECFLGCGELLSDIILKGDGTSSQWPHMVADTRKASTGLTSDYERLDAALPSNEDTGNAGRYPSWARIHDGLMYGSDNGGSQTTGMGDQAWVRPNSNTTDSVFSSGGHLNNARSGGPFYAYGTNALTPAFWSFGSRPSALGRSRG